MQRKLLGLFVLLAALGSAACRPPFSAPLHEAELALQLSKRDSTGCTAVLYSRDLGVHPNERSGIRFQHVGSNATSQTAVADQLEWNYLGSRLGTDVYEVRHRETVGGKLVKPVKKAVVRFNGKDPVVAWDDSRYILVRSLARSSKKGIIQGKHGVQNP
jgi:hypothetical protein